MEITYFTDVFNSQNSGEKRERRPSISVLFERLKWTEVQNLFRQTSPVVTKVSNILIEYKAIKIFLKKS